jgi:hypothetical protein
MPDAKMEKLTIPRHPELIEALGRLAVAHTHLELIFRYTVKTLAPLTVKEALDATNGEKISEVRKRVRKLFIEISFPIAAVLHPTEHPNCLLLKARSFCAIYFVCHQK